MRFEDLADRDVVIWGAGREGRAAHAELARRGIAARFALTGDAPAPTDLAAPVTTGPAAVDLLLAADVVIKSPGVPRTSPDLVRVRAAGVAVTSLTDLWLAANAARALAVTGTKGKSTTSAIARHLLASVGVSASLVGNGGTPVTEGDSTAAAVAVTEVSSYQAADLAVSPRIAVVTSLYPEHLPWHGGYEQYVADKLNLIAHGPEVVVLPALDGDLADLVRERVGPASRLVAPADLGIAVSAAGIDWAGIGRLASDEIPIRGRHNHVNVALALTAVTAGLDLPSDTRPRLLAAVQSFAPLAHRLETVPSADGRRWVDDSLATAPEAVVAALEAYADSPVTLLLGGADRGLDFEPLRAYLAERPTTAPVEVVAVGPAGARWLAEGGPRTRHAGSFAQALDWIRADPDASDVVLLSPGAPSFDEFADYEERSAAFRAAAARGSA